MSEGALVRGPMCLALQSSTAGGELTLDRERELNRFLADVERRAFRIARFAVRDTEEALDIVQEAMIRLARHYGQRGESEWRPLFYRILTNRIRDWQRRARVRSRVMVWSRANREEDDWQDPVGTAPDPAGRTPQEQAVAHETLDALERAVEDLPARQQQAFLLRTFEGLDVAQTARAMGCSQGSVKTHYSRAVHSLRAQLGEYWS